MRTLKKMFKSVLILVLVSHSNGYERITDDAIIVEGINSFISFINGVLKSYRIYRRLQRQIVIKIKKRNPKYKRYSLLVKLRVTSCALFTGNISVLSINFVVQEKINKNSNKVRKILQPQT